MIGERFAQTAHVNVYGSLLDIHVGAPYAVEQLSATVDPVRVSKEEMQKSVFSRSESNIRSIGGNPVAGRNGFLPVHFVRSRRDFHEYSPQSGHPGRMPDVQRSVGGS